MRKALPAVMCK